LRNEFETPRSIEVTQYRFWCLFFFKIRLVWLPRAIRWRHLGCSEFTNGRVARDQFTLWYGNQSGWFNPISVVWPVGSNL